MLEAELDALDLLSMQPPARGRGRGRGRGGAARGRGGVPLGPAAAEAVLIDKLAAEAMELDEAPSDGE